MKELLQKEIFLTASPLTYFFLAFSAMTMIPGYPILVGAFFVCLGIFYSFQSAREYNDTLYTALLPVRKSDVVKAKYAFTVAVQLISFFLNAILSTLRMTILKDTAAYIQNPMMNANLAYLGYVLILFSLFNTIFLSGFFQTAYYIGKPFVIFSVAAFVVIGIGETLHHIPGLQGLNSQSSDGFFMQGILLSIGILLYIVGTCFSFKISERRFYQIDL